MLCQELSRYVEWSRFPHSMKVPNIALFFKKDDWMDKANYWPISILLNLPKVWERCLYNRPGPQKLEEGRCCTSSNLLLVESTNFFTKVLIWLKLLNTQNCSDYMILLVCRDEISTRPAWTDFTLRLYGEIKFYLGKMGQFPSWYLFKFV